jgi:hypothetical protein
MDGYTPSTVPGCRTPHFFRDDGSSLYDAMGPEFTLLRFDPALDVAVLAAAAGEKRVPLGILDVKSPDTAAYDGGRLVLSRPDQHVAWRGDSVPDDPVALIDRIRGAAKQLPEPAGATAPIPRWPRSIPSARRAGAAPSDP